MKMRTLAVAVALAGSSAILPRDVQALDGDFFAGKTISLVVGISAGGGYDQYARLLARHYPKHIPGSPTIVVRNMPGAGSLSAVLYTANVAPADGQTVTAFNSGLLNDSMSEGENAKVRFDQFAWLGSMARDLRVCYAMKGKGVRTLADLKTRPAVFGGAGQNSSSTNNVLMLRNLLGLKLKIIPAYRGNTEMNLAAERGEVDGSCISWTSVPEDWVKSDRIEFLALLSRASAPGIPSHVRFLGDIVETQEQKDVIDVLLSSGEIGRPFILSAKVPRDRLSTLRRGFDASMADRELQEDAAKLRLDLSAVSGEEAEAIVQKLYRFPAETVEKAKVAIRE